MCVALASPLISACRRAAPSAEFSVDRTRHLMSFLTMLGPSPDWNVGLSAEDLCTKDCGWVQRVIQDLIPWDAGTDSGVTYEVSKLVDVCLECRQYLRSDSYKGLGNARFWECCLSTQPYPVEPVPLLGNREKNVQPFNKSRSSTLHETSIP